jgi:hypothetical protein
MPIDASVHNSYCPFPYMFLPVGGLRRPHPHQDLSLLVSLLNLWKYVTTVWVSELPTWKVSMSEPTRVNGKYSTLPPPLCAPTQTMLKSHGRMALLSSFPEGRIQCMIILDVDPSK